MPGGPKPIDHQQRIRTAQEIADQFMKHYGSEVLAIGLYGSLARDMDGPYSDIEMYCVLKGSGIDDCVEWSEGDWKAEVNLYSREVLLAYAAEIDEDWPFTHGCYMYIKPLYDPESVFPAVREAVFAHSKEVFQQVIQEIIVGDVYEIVGKVRNAVFFSHSVNLPYFATKMAVYGACLIALDARHLYPGFMKMFEESLQLPDRPEGYDALCKMVMSGMLSDSIKIAQAVDRFWAGLEQWAEQRQLVIEQRLSDLLEKKARHL